MKKTIFIAFIPLFALVQFQTSNLPVKEWSSPSQTPFVLYISGDGGFNNFSTDLCGAINNAGYNVTAINAKSYFWNKKDPEQAAKDFAVYLDRAFQNRKNQQLVLVGYSFGADVLPFIVNKMPDFIKSKLISVVLLSPSSSTDFEVHWSDMLGGNKKRKMDVADEINRMGLQKTVFIFASDEREFPVKNIKLKNYSIVNLPGGHHYDDHTDEVGKTIEKYFK